MYRDVIPSRTLEEGIFCWFPVGKWVWIFPIEMDFYNTIEQDRALHIPTNTHSFARYADVGVLATTDGVFDGLYDDGPFGYVNPVPEDVLSVSSSVYIRRL